MLSHPTKSPAAVKDRWADASVLGALLASTALSGFGVVSAFWEGLADKQPAAWAGLAIVGLAMAASEVGAVTLARSLTRDGMHRDAVTILRGSLFALTTAANVMAGHFGAEAINTRLVEPQRAPYEQRLASAHAAVGAAQNSLDAWVSLAADERAALERQLEAERAATPGAVTARARAAQAARDSIAERQRAERVPYEQTLAAAQQEEAQAQAAIAQAPQGFEQVQIWALAFLLECLKGVLVWVTAPRRRRADPAGNILPIEPAAYRDMDELELADILSRGRTASALAQHELRRRTRAA